MWLTLLFVVLWFPKVFLCLMQSLLTKNKKMWVTIMILEPQNIKLNRGPLGKQTHSIRGCTNNINPPPTIPKQRANELYCVFFVYIIKSDCHSKGIHQSISASFSVF